MRVLRSLAAGRLAGGLILAPGPALAQTLAQTLAQDPGPMAWSVGLVIGALVVFVAAMSWLLAMLAARLLAEARAIGAPALVRLTELPCGVPDGTIRALISCFIVIFGFLLIGLQKPLGLASAEALTGFIGAVISFYFVTRNGETRQGGPLGLPPATAPAPVADAGQAAAGSTALARARGVLDAAGVATGLAVRLAPGSVLARRAEAVAAGARQVLDATAAALHGGDAAAIAGAAATAEGLVRRVIGQDNPATAVIAAALARFGGAPALLGIGGPVGLVAALGVGAFQAIAQGTGHFERWRARVLDLPYAAGLFPPAPVDAAVALSALELSPIFARVFLTPAPAPAARFALAARLALLVRQEAPAVQAELMQPGRFADVHDFAAGLREFRGRLLDEALDAVDAAPLDLAPAGLAGRPPVPQRALRDAVAALRQDPETPELDRLVLLLTGLATSPDLKREEAMALLRHQLAAAGGEAS